MFSNINADKDQLLQLILVGQPELRELVRQPVLQQFAQRIASDFHLRAFTAEESDAYILHRLAHAGASREVIDAAARAMIHVAGRGIPRLINQLCDYALVYAYSEERPVVDASLVREVLEDRRHSGMFRVDEALTMVLPPVSAGSWPAPQTGQGAAPAGGSGDAAGAPGDASGWSSEPQESSAQDDGDRNVFYGVWDRQV